jgi:uncharacterized RDD family membrane protein YckC
MVNTQLLDYVRQQLAQGLSKETIERNLTTAGGWTIVDISEAFSAVGANQTTSVPIPPAPPISPTSHISVSPAPAFTMSANITTKYAGFWIRFVAVMVDGIILVIPIGALQFLTSAVSLSSGLPSKTVSIISALVYLLVTWGYFSLMTYFAGATLGKMLVGITVKSDDLGKLSFGRVILRETLGKIISQVTIYIGFIIAGFTKKKQGLHDMIARSVVVYKDPSKSHTAGLIVGIIIACVLPALAILGILSSVVLVSLNVARQKGVDANIQTVISEMRTQIESQADVTNVSNQYSVARNCSSGIFASPQIVSTISQLKDKNVLNCFAEGSSYAISAPLGTTGQNFCLDSVGYSGNAIAVDDGSKASCQVSSTN